MRRVMFVSFVFAIGLVAVSPAGAQPLGTFRWQLQPFCNVVTLAVTQNGSVYRVEGTDDRCGNGADQASAIGTAFQNPDGSIGIGLSIVASPNATPINVDASIALASLSGSWRDTAGNSGSFTFTPGAGSGGNPRPLPAQPAGGDVTGVVAGTGLTGGGSAGDVALAVDNSVVQNRVSGACATGQAVRSINQNGTVACETIPPSPVPAAIKLDAFGSLVASGAINTGLPPASGPGVRMMWYPAKAAFRAGSVDSGAWDSASLGYGSVAFGFDTRGSGYNSTALGDRTLASGNDSTAMGILSQATGEASTALGTQGKATGDYSTSMGQFSVASGVASMAVGFLSKATGDRSVAMGDQAAAGGSASFAAGRILSAGGNASVALGSLVSASTAGTFMFGDTSANTNMITTLPNQFLVRAAGGTGFYSNSALTAGVELAPGANAWSSASDSTKKTAFRDLSHDDVLDKIAQMAVSEWSYIAQGESIRHIGPTAQDFYAAFGLGEDPLRISTIDADGVALAAVRALEARTRELQRINDALERRVAALEALLTKKQP